MLRRPAGNGLTTNTTSISSNVNQENVVFHQKVVDAKNGPLTRPVRQSALHDIKNQPNQAGPHKRAISLKQGHNEGTAALSKEARRPLRPTASSSNAPVGGGKNVDCKPSRGVAKAIAFQTTTDTTANFSTTSSVLSNNSTLNATAAANTTTTTNKIKAASGSFIASKSNVIANAAAGHAKPRLFRSNATSTLNATTKPKTTTAANGTLKTDTTELANLQPMTKTLAPLAEENENATSKTPVPDNVGYSSSMMTNIDADDEDNPQMVCAYVNEIYDYLRKLEQEQQIKENFLEGKEVNGRMRSILIDWLSQVHIRFHLLPETLYMTVALIDRFLQAISVPKEKLQLVGVTAMFIASKYEEMYAPEIGDFVYITDHSCEKQDIRMMECLLLRTLGFKLGRPLPIHFLRRYSKAADADATKHTMAKYFLELSLCHYPLSHFPPSIMAASALWLALKLLDPSFQWNATLIHYSKYREADFMPCLRRMCRAVVKTHTADIKQQAIRNKFSTSKFLDISKHPCLNLASVRKYAEC